VSVCLCSKLCEFDDVVTNEKSTECAIIVAIQSAA
jgi:hypothetical protein